MFLLQLILIFLLPMFCHHISVLVSPLSADALAPTCRNPASRFLPLPSTGLPQSKTAETLQLFPWEHDWLVIFVSEMESLVGFVLLAGLLISDQRMSRRKSSEAKTQHKPQALFSLIGLASTGKHITANSYTVKVWWWFIMFISLPSIFKGPAFYPFSHRYFSVKTPVEQLHTISYPAKKTL